MQVDKILIYRTVQHCLIPATYCPQLILNLENHREELRYLSNVLILDCFCQFSLLQIRGVYPGSNNNNKYEGEKFAIIPFFSHNLTK
jgi:hypothetical protein